MARLLRRLISVAIGLSLPFANASPGFAAAPLARAQYEECQARDEAGLKSAITAISAEALKNGVKAVDYRALVAEQWRKSGLDDVIDKRVDVAIEEVRAETSWSQLLESLAKTETSQKLAQTVAERVYRSDAVKAAIESMASGVASEVGETIEFASADASSPLLECLKAFLGPRYGSAVAEAVAGDANKSLALDPQQGAGEVSVGAVLKESGGGIAGATLLVVRRQLANLATRVGQRLVGSVLSRLVSVAAGGVGLVLIAKDIWELRNGVLPIIATEMKAKATKEKVREEIATSLSEQINEHLGDIATASADHVVEIWQAFKVAHSLVLRIAEGNAEFRTFLDAVKPQSLLRLDEVVALLVAAEGEDSVLKRLNDGSLNVAVHQMPEAAMTIARDQKSVAEALDWTALAGDELAAVLDLELHRRAKAADFTASSLKRLLDLKDRTAIQRLAAAPRGARDTLLSLGTSDLSALAKSLSDDELSSLAGYLTGLTEAPRARVLGAIAADPAKMRILASSSVRNAIISSTDQSAAADMMLRHSGASPRQLYDDAAAAWSGRINPWLLWHKHPIGVVAGLLVFALMVAWLGRLFRPRPTDHPPASA